MASMGTSSRKRPLDVDDVSPSSSSSQGSKDNQSTEGVQSSVGIMHKVKLHREHIAAAKLELESERAQYAEHRCQLEAQYQDLESFEPNGSGGNKDASTFLSDIQQAIQSIETQEERLNARLSELDEEFGKTFEAKAQTSSSGQEDLQQQIQQEKQRLQDLQGRKLALVQSLNGMDIDKKSVTQRTRKRRRVEAEDRVLRWLQGSCMEPIAGPSEGLHRSCSGEAVVDTQA